MSALCLQLPVVLCLCWTALTDAGVSGVQWKKSGNYITIQCRPASKDSEVQDSLSLKRGVNGEFDVYHADGLSTKEIVAKEYQGRLQTDGVFPNKDILIRNLSPNDTELYLCMYSRYDRKSYQIVKAKGEGSVLLMVKEDKPAEKDVEKGCGPSGQELMMVCLVIVGAMLLLIIVSVLIWIIRKKSSGRTSRKPNRVQTNDVYEEMRGTLRH